MYHHQLEALREKEAASKMIIGGDYMNARQKLLKAQQLFPALDHIVPMLTVCDILSAARINIPFYDVDHYWVLQLMPSSTLCDVRCRYQKFVKLLQPIKNKFPGTELALRFVVDAFFMLSDPGKRFDFDMKRGTSWEGYESFDMQTSTCHGIPGEERGITAEISSTHDKVSFVQGLDARNEMGLPTDRVRDLGSKLQANHNMKENHVNISLSEPSSYSSDLNSERNTRENIDMPVNDVNSPPVLYQNSSGGNPSWYVPEKRLDQDFYEFGKNRKSEHFKTLQIWAAHYQSTEPQNFRYAQINDIAESAVSVTWLKPVPVGEGERRWCEAGLPVACGSFCLDLDMSENVVSPLVFSYICSWVHGTTMEQFEIYPRRGEVWALYEDWNLDEWSYDPGILKCCKFKLVEILSDFSKYLGANCACLVKVDGFKSVFQQRLEEGDPVVLHISPNNFYMLSHNVPAYRFTGGEIDGAVRGMFELDQLALPDDTVQDMDSQVTPKEGNSESSFFTNPVEQLPTMTSCIESKILGPNWSPNYFATGQVWAVYCGRDLMPRQYIQLDKVISGSQVCVTFLEPLPSFDYESTWMDKNLHLACGVFRASGTTVNLEMSQLSHQVNCQQSTTRPIFKIYPVKGEIWSVYRTWNNEGKHTDYETYQYWVVEILSDFSEGERMRIARLAQVEGYLTFFQRHQHDGFDLTRAVSKTETLRFSHQIPAFRVPGIGRHGIPESSWHLEPNALPTNLGN
ncbi:unnamed protein product [Ilex paraguariensis]|uniref:DUF3444 domain-containing protein n=1 Tax=Ilex paraguariensis TaxID=185542 RepID=A0ABC8UBG0_9AQUA